MSIKDAAIPTPVRSVPPPSGAENRNLQQTAQPAQSGASHARRGTGMAQKPILVPPPGAKSSQSKKRSNASTASRRGKASVAATAAAAAAIQAVNYIDHPEIKSNDVLWISPEPGYGTPKNLTEMEDNTGKVFVRWLSWEKGNNIGYTLFDEQDAKWWADAASVHILSRAQGFKITFDCFSFVVKRENRIFNYGFITKHHAQEANLRNFIEFGREMNGEEPLIKIKPPQPQPEVPRRSTILPGQGTTPAITIDEEDFLLSEHDFVEEVEEEDESIVVKNENSNSHQCINGDPLN